LRQELKGLKQELLQSPELEGINARAAKRARDDRANNKKYYAQEDAKQRAIEALGGIPKPADPMELTPKEAATKQSLIDKLRAALEKAEKNIPSWRVGRGEGHRKTKK